MMANKIIKIMFVDDDKDQLFSLRTAFENNYGKAYNIITAKSGKECLELLKKNIIPDLILLDIMMPDMNGWEVFDKLKADPKYKHIPIVFLTARTDGLAEHAGVLIADDYIKKPIGINELKSRIDTVINKKIKSL
jgi:CheY-like chemotaxis protein